MKYNNRRRAGSGQILAGKNYLRFTALENCEFWFNGTGNTNVLCSIDEGHHWQQSNIIISVSAGKSVIWKQSSDYVPTDNTSIGLFHSTGAFNISGSIASLIDGDGDFESIETVPYNNLFAELFKGNPIIDASDLYLIGPSEGCYKSMFENCNNLLNRPYIGSSNTATNCYKCMFKGCSSLTSLAYLSLDEAAAESCCESMYEGCTSLSDVYLYINICGTKSFKRMFAGCTHISQPNMQISTFATECCASMFENCTSLQRLLNFKITNVATQCFENMFAGCTNLTEPPVIKVKTFPSTTDARCCAGMFSGCSSLSAIYCYAEDNITGNSNNFDGWVNGVASSGIFYKPLNVNTWPTGNSGIPTNWSTKSVDAIEYFNIVSLSDNNVITIKRYAYGRYTGAYAINSIDTWRSLAMSRNEIRTITLNNGDRLYIRGDYTPGLTITASDTFKVRGNILSLAHNLFIIHNTTTSYSYAQLFDGASTLVDASNLILPSNVIGNCYEYMFAGCSSLITPPQLPATTLAAACYKYMFYSCTALTNAPELPATTLANECYRNMFNGCSSLTYIKCLATDISATNCTTNWVASVSPTGTFIKDSNMSSWTTGISGIPSGWTVQDAS